MKYLLISFLICLFSISQSYSKEFIPERTDKNGYEEPFQMFDNLFYVGDKWASSYLVRTTDGLVLIETLESPYGRWIPGNVKKLGLDPSDIKYILVTHGHSDHVGNAEYIQRHYGSQVVMSKDALQMSKEQSKKSKGKGHFEAPHVDIFVKDGDNLVIGDTKFTFYTTQGHTKGCVSIDFVVKNAGVPYRAFMVGGHSPSKTDINLVDAFIKSMERIRTIALQEPKVSVNLANHPHKNHLFEKRAQGINNSKKNYFIDSKGFFEFLNEQEAIGKKKLAELQSNANTSIHPRAKALGD